MPIIVGLLLAVSVAALAKFTRFDRDRSFYPTMIIIIASYYVLFAVMGGSTRALGWEMAVALAFSTVAIFGSLHAPVLVGTGIIAHSLFDLVHDVLVDDAGVPTWWPSFCASVDGLLGLWVMILSRSRSA